MHIMNKANQSLGLLQRNLSSTSSSVKEQAYLTYVHPKMEFVSILWNPYHQKDIHTSEMVQRHATHITTNAHDCYSSVTIIVSQLQWENLQDRRSKAWFIKLVMD